MFIFCVINTCAISRVYIRSLTPALPATATYKFSLSFSSCIVHYAHNSSLYSYAFSFRGILIQIYENCDDLWRNFIRRRKTVIFLNSCRMCCACFVLHYITLHYYIIQLTPRWVFSVTDYIRHYDFLCYLLSLDYSPLQQLRYYSSNYKKIQNK
jgi:hypothetical protein